MKILIFNVIQSLLGKLGYALIFRKKLEQLIESQKNESKFAVAFAVQMYQNKLLLKEIPTGFVEYSKSQFGQDLLALLVSNFKKNGFFVEFGATNGIDLSNTYLLEKYFDWDGILAEPAKSWHHDLYKNRSCKISTKCISQNSFKQVEFLERISSLEHSSINRGNQQSTKNSITYSVATTSLNDLLIEFSAPKIIDYISIDTEGNEIEILEEFSFPDWQVNFISVEHNFSSSRETIFKLMEKNGFIRILKTISNVDDYYLKTSTPNFVEIVEFINRISFELDLEDPKICL